MVVVVVMTPSHGYRRRLRWWGRGWGWRGGHAAPLLPSSVHERHGALGLVAEDAGEELQRQSHVQGHEHVRGVDHHGDGGEEHQVEQGLLPRLQHVDAGDEHVLVVEPGQGLAQVLHAHHVARWWRGGREAGRVRAGSAARSSPGEGDRARDVHIELQLIHSKNKNKKTTTLAGMGKLRSGGHVWPVKLSNLVHRT